MTQHFEFSFFSSSSGDTVERGKQLGAHLTAGSVIGLVGDLGAGKTCFIKGIAEGLNNTPANEVTSPTFTILQEYPGPVPLYHFDAYRLSGSHDLEAIGFEDYVGTDGVAVIEWADRISDALPGDAIMIRLEAISENERQFFCRARGTKHCTILSLFRDCTTAVQSAEKAR
jgi:tRNA threonylcarbamoyladenosine biosynthesis protein TsaE